MALKIFWTKEAILSFNGVIEYLTEHWTEKEINYFIERVEKILHLLTEGNVTFKRSKKKGYNETLVTKHNLLVYKIKPNQIDLILFWDTRKNPSKRKL